MASCIQKHGSEVAERYLLHEDIELWKAAEKYDQYCTHLGYPVHDTAELALLRSRRDELCLRFGNSFKGDYGWAAEVLMKNRPTFSDIEQAVLLDHLRPYYKMASHSVHANLKGIVFDIRNVDGEISKSPNGCCVSSW